jgi:hypothetical protein
MPPSPFTNIIYFMLNELLRKEFLTQIENLYTKFLSSSYLMQLAAPFIQKSLALRRFEFSIKGSII